MRSGRWLTVGGAPTLELGSLSVGSGNMTDGTSKAAAVHGARQVAVDDAEQHLIRNAVTPGRILTGKPTIGSASLLSTLAEKRHGRARGEHGHLY